jgi:hypothetical protein
MRWLFLKPRGRAKHSPARRPFCAGLAAGDELAMTSKATDGFFLARIIHGIARWGLRAPKQTVRHGGKSRIATMHYRPPPGQAGGSVPKLVTSAFGRSPGIDVPITI